MGTVARLLVAGALVLAATAAAAAPPLKPQWSKPVGGKARLAGVEEYGRCSVFVDKGVVQIVSPAGDILWTWPFATVSRYINPSQVAVSHACDAIAFVGDASYKYAWIVQRGGRSISIPFTVTPTPPAFDRSGEFVAVGTFSGALHLYSRSGELQWKRDAGVAIVSDLMFTDDNSHIVFRGWAGAGVISFAGHVEWGLLANRLAASRDLGTFIISDEPNHGPGLPRITAVDDRRNSLWFRWGTIEAFVSANGQRILASVDRNQQKADDDFYGVDQEREVQLLSRDGQVIATFADYQRPVALSEDGTRAWLQADDHLACVDEQGEELARIDATTSHRSVIVSRDFAQVLLVREKNLDPVSVERYEVPQPCRP